MKRIIGTGLSILLFSALSTTTVKAQTRYEHQLGLTNHSVVTSTKGPIQVAVQMPEPTPMKSKEAIPTVRPITSGNPYSGRDRLIHERQNEIVLPAE